MRKISILLLSIILFACSNDKKEIVKTFNDFNKANIELDGERIYTLSDSESHDYYKSLLTKILKLDSVGVTELNLSDKLNLLSARAIIPNAELKKISPKDLMIAMYTEVNSMDSTKINSINKTGVTNIKVDEDIAYSDLTINGNTLSPSVNLKFLKENGEWKFNVVSMADFTEKQLNKICEQNGFTHMYFIEWVFSASNVGNKKIKALDSVWHPIIK